MKPENEKHLQDWIWGNRELFPDWNPSDQHVLQYLDVFAREYRLPSGIADFIALDPTGIFVGVPRVSIKVIETKRDAINLKTLAQTLRYIRDIQRIWSFAVAGEIELSVHGDYFSGIPCVEGLMIGKSTTEDVLIAADAANVAIAIYEFDGANYAFEWATVKGHRRSTYLSYYDSELGEKIREAYKNAVDIQLSVFMPTVDRSKLMRNIDINTQWRIFGEDKRTL